MGSDLVISPGNKIAVFKTPQDRYTTLLAFPEVTQALSETDKIIANSSLKLSIGSMGDEELTKDVAVIVTFVCRDLGITQLGNVQEMKYTSTRFLGMLKRHYKDLTITDVKLAFEFLEVGKLDPFLPLDRNKKPDREHYQQFNLKFYTKVLNAYRRVKSGVWGKAQNAYGKHETKLLQYIPKEEREANHKSMIQEIHKAFEDYKEKGVKPHFVLSIFIREFIDAGLLKLPKPTKDQIKTAYEKKIVDQNLPRVKRKEVIAQFSVGKVPGLVKNEAQRIANNYIIKDYFDAIIKSKTKIEDVIK